MTTLLTLVSGPCEKQIQKGHVIFSLSRVSLLYVAFWNIKVL